VRPVFHLVVGLLLLAGTPVLPLRVVSVKPSRPSPAPANPSTVTAVVYVYEKDESAIPVGVTSGINRLNRERKVRATLFERDTVDGFGKTPEQYRPALDAARRESIPALVVLSGTSVVRVVKAPKTEADVLGVVP
jgi:hypothetical protein